MTKPLFYGKLYKKFKEANKMAKNVSSRKNMSGNNRPFSLKATKKTQKVNLQTVTMNGKKVRVSAKELRSMEK